MWMSQAVNAIILPVLLFYLIKLANDRRILGEWVNSRLQNTLARIMVLLILATTAFLFISLLL